MGKMTVPQVCISCGNFIGLYPFNFNRAHCEYCGYDGDIFLEFYFHCQQLEEGMNNNVTTSGKLREAAHEKLMYGWMPNLLAILSAIVLGILTNASYDLVKEWVLSKKEKYEKRYGGLFQYEKAVDALLEYLINNEDQIKGFRIIDSEINIRFNEHLSEIRKEIEKISTDEKSNKT